MALSSIIHFYTCSEQKEQKYNSPDEALICQISELFEINLLHITINRYESGMQDEQEDDQHFGPILTLKTFHGITSGYPKNPLGLNSVSDWLMKHNYECVLINMNRSNVIYRIPKKYQDIRIL